MSEKFVSAEERASYGIGLQLGEQLKRNPFDGLSLEAVADGINDAFLGNDSKLDNDALRAAFASVNEKLQASKNEQFKANIEQGAVFLEENAKRDEIIVTESGLQYEIIDLGEGEKPSLQSTVRTHYHGTLINGDTFDSSYERGEPAEFPVSGVIKGWTEALQMMPIGSKWRLYVPHDLAYGENGAGGAIEPFSALIFDVELLDIVG